MKTTKKKIHVHIDYTPILYILGLGYPIACTMYFLLMVPTQLGYDGIAVPITYAVAQWSHAAASYLAPIVAGIVCLGVIGIVSVLIALLLDLIRSLITGD
jgi:hypothetical protein